MAAFKVLFPLLGATGVAAAAGTVYWHMAGSKPSKDAPWESYVKEHTKIQELYQGKLWQVSGKDFGVPAARSMTIYRLKNTQDLVLHSPIALNEQEMEIMQMIGEPKIIVLPNESDTSVRDLAAYKKRFPASIVAAPSSVVNKLKSQGYEVDTSLEDVFVNGIAKDSGVELIEPPMVKLQETILDVPLEYGERGLMFGELIANLKMDSGITGRLLWFNGLVSDGKQPQVPGAHRSWAFRSRQDFLKFFSQLADQTQSKDIYRVVTMQHGLPLYFNIPRKLRKIVEGYQNSAPLVSSSSSSNSGNSK